MIPSADLERSAAQTVKLMRELNTLVKEPGARLAPTTGSAPTKRAVYPAPWNTPAGNLFTTLGAAARDHELDLSLLLFAVGRYRGTSDDNTFAAILRLPTLIGAAIRADHAEHNYVTTTVVDLVRWPPMLRRFLDHDPEQDDPQPWTKAPGNLSCPHCNRRLWLKPGWQHQGPHAAVYCRQCHDDDGHILSWPAAAWIAVLQHGA